MEKYIIIDGERSGEEITEDNITLAEFSEEDVAEYMEHSWNRGESPNLVIPLSVIEFVLKNTEKPVTLKELMGEADEV